MNTRARKSYTSLQCAIIEIGKLVPDFNTLYAMKRYAFIFAYQTHYFNDVRTMNLYVLENSCGKF